MFAISLLTASCHLLESSVPEGDVLLAELGDQQLFLSEVAGLVPTGSSAADSLDVLRQFIDRWVYDAALTEEANRTLGNSSELERLVADYRASLLRHAYEEQVAAQGLDTTITDGEVQALYDQLSSSEVLSQGLIQATLYKFVEPQAEAESFATAWSGRSDSLERLVVEELAAQHAVLALADRNTWYELPQLAALLPNGQLGSAGLGGRVVRSDGFVYYLDILNRVDAGQPAPLGYLKERLKKAILEQRRGEYLAAANQRVLLAARQRDEVKIYLGNE